MKNAYFVTQEEKLANRGSSSNLLDNKWKNLWSLSVPNKVKNFLCRAHHNSLPTKPNMYNRRVIINNLCSICSQEAKLVAHLLWNCGAANDIWANFIPTHKWLRYMVYFDQLWDKLSSLGQMVLEKSTKNLPYYCDSCGSEEMSLCSKRNLCLSLV